MNSEARKIRNKYLILYALIWLPTALIIGINTLFLLDGGLNNVQAFAANAFYTVGLLVFEIPTGMVADSWGRRTSYLLGAATQAAGVLLYVYMWYVHGPFWGWALASVILGLGYTFWSGALEAWCVDALKAVKYRGPMDSIFAKSQIVNGVGMLVGIVSGGFIAQLTNLGVPYVVRSAIHVLSFVVGLIIMKDLGFKPERAPKLGNQVRSLFRASIKHGLRNPPVRWVMLAGPFLFGTLIYAFYAAQPHLLNLFGDQKAIGVAGLAAALLSGGQIGGGFIVPAVRKIFKRRTSILLASGVATVGALTLIGLAANFYFVLLMLTVWAVAFAATLPVRQAYINSLIPSKQRATVLSFDSMVSSSGGVVFQPILGRVADVSGYGASFVASGVVAFFSVPFLYLARREKVPTDKAKAESQATAPAPPPGPPVSETK